MQRMYEDYPRDRRTRIAHWLSERTEAEMVTGICERWIHDLADSNHEPHSLHDLPGMPPELNLVIRLSHAGLNAYSAALNWQIEDGQGTSPFQAPLISHALAVASGRAYVAYGPSKLNWIESLVSTIDHQVWEAFADSAAAALREDTQSCSDVVEFVTAIVKESIDAPDRVVEIASSGTSMASIVDKFALTRNFQEVWHADFLPIFFRHSTAFEILRRADPERFLELIDKLPHPAMVGACLNSKGLVENAEEVLRLLRLADVSFEAEGRWQWHGMAAILLLKLASDQLLSTANSPDRKTSYAEPLAGSAESLAAEQAQNLAEGVNQFRKAADNLLDVVFERPDGVVLGWHWLENLLRQTPPNRSPSGGGSSSKHAIDRIGILVHALSRRLAPRRTQGAWITDGEPLARLFRSVSVLSVAAFSSIAGDLDLGAVAVELLKRNDIQMTGASELIQQPAAPLRTIPGYALARLPRVASWFTETWLALRFEREQAWHALGRHDGVHPNTAEIMGIWGLGVIEVLAADETRCGDPRGMWLALEAAFREARLVEPRIVSVFWTEALSRLFHWWPPLFVLRRDWAVAEKTPPDTPMELSKVLAPYVGISRDFMGIIVSLYHAGVDVTVINHAASSSGQDLSRMIRRFLETTRGLKDTRFWNQEWVAALGAIEAAIAAQQLAAEGASA